MRAHLPTFSSIQSPVTEGVLQRRGQTLGERIEKGSISGWGQGGGGKGREVASGRTFSASLQSQRAQGSHTDMSGKRSQMTEPISHS